jgi:hypothetical protein
MRRRVFLPKNSGTILTLAGLSLSCLLGCTPKTTTPEDTASPVVRGRPSPSPTPPNFSSLPDQVDHLAGTPLLSVAMDINREIKQPLPDEGASFFVLLSSTQPDHGVLVEVKNTKPADLQSRSSQPIEVSGPVKTLDDPHLKDYCASKLSLILSTRDGHLEYIQPSDVLFSPTPSPLPNTMPSPIPSSIPGATSPTPQSKVPLGATTTPMSQPSPQVSPGQATPDQGGH